MRENWRIIDNQPLPPYTDHRLLKGGNAMTGERLSWLIRTLGSSGKELSHVIGIDCSTMSKWRKGKRTLKYNSDYARRIAQWAVHSPIEQQTGILAQMLQEWQPSLHIDSTEQKADALRLWLTLTKQPEVQLASERKSVQVPADILIGMEKMLDAQNTMFRLMYELPGKQEMVMMDFGAVDWSACPRHLLENCVEENLNALTDPQHTMTIIDQLSDTYRPRELMFQWMPIYLQSNVQTCFYRNPKPLPLRQNVLLIRGHAVLLMSSTASDPTRVLSIFYDDPSYIQMFEEMADTLIADSRPMIEVMETRLLIPFLRQIGQHIRSSHLLYMINQLPTFRNMPPELLDEILQYNQVTGRAYEECMAAGRQSTATRTRCESRQLYNLDAIEEAMERDYTIDADLSAVVGRDVLVTREHLRKQLLFLREHLRARHYSLTIYPFSRLELHTSPPCNLIVQDDSMAAAWDAGQYTQRMYSEEMSVISGFYQYADSLWEQISPACHAEAWCQRRIDALLAIE